MWICKICTRKPEGWVQKYHYFKTEEGATLFGERHIALLDPEDDSRYFIVYPEVHHGV